MQNKLGRIKIKYCDLVEEKYYRWLLDCVFSRMVVIRMKRDFKNNILEYEGYCELFDRVEKTKEGFTTRAKYYDLALFEKASDSVLVNESNNVHNAFAVLE